MKTLDYQMGLFSKEIQLIDVEFGVELAEQSFEMNKKFKIITNPRENFLIMQKENNHGLLHGSAVSNES